MIPSGILHETAQDTSWHSLCQLTNPVFLTQTCSVDPAGCEEPAHTDPNTQKMYILRSPDLKWQPKEGMGFNIVVLWVVTTEQINCPFVFSAWACFLQQDINYLQRSEKRWGTHQPDTELQHQTKQCLFSWGVTASKKQDSLFTPNALLSSSKNSFSQHMWAQTFTQFAVNNVLHYHHQDKHSSDHQDLKMNPNPTFFMCIHSLGYVTSKPYSCILQATQCYFTPF